MDVFYGSLTDADRWFLRYDVSDRSVVDRWFDGIGKEHVRSIIATCEDKVVGHGTLHKRIFGSTKHVGRFRIMVLPQYRQMRLGTWMLLDLIQLAMDDGLEAIRTDLVVGVEDTAIEAVRKFDFFREATLSEYVKDLAGNKHDLAIMVKRLHKSWSDY
jgi:GNAT superfamily N-acetyltransferase